MVEPIVALQDGKQTFNIAPFAPILVIMESVKTLV
jgi:hypothetical protein